MKRRVNKDKAPARLQGPPATRPRVPLFLRSTVAAAPCNVGVSAANPRKPCSPPVRTQLGVDAALGAAKLSVDLKLPMAYCVMLATARRHGATFWTHHPRSHFVQGVRYKKSS